MSDARSVSSTEAWVPQSGPESAFTPTSQVVAAASSAAMQTDHEEGLQERLRKQEEELKRLRTLEARVIGGDYSVLSEFASNASKPDIALKNPINEVDVGGKRIPVSILPLDEFSPEKTAFIVANAKKCFPKVEFRESESVDGRPVLVMVGIDPKTANAALAMESKKAALTESVEKLAAQAQAAVIAGNIPETAKNSLGSTDLTGLRGVAAAVTVDQAGSPSVARVPERGSPQQAR